MKVIDLGRISFTDAVNVQLERVEAIAKGGENTLYLLEHDPVVTVGQGAKPDSLLVTPEYLEWWDIDMQRARRGGDLTCHYHGQLVAYPLFRLDKHPGGVRAFFHELEDVIIGVVRRFGVQGDRMEGRPGVWVEGRKIGSIGIGMRKWVSFHGLSLNVVRDMSLFSLIKVCGLDGVEPTSLYLELEKQGKGGENRTFPTMAEVKDACVQEFQRVFAPA